MQKLKDLRIKTSYHKGRDDIADEFYLPCMNRSVTYDRAVGYFSSSIYVLAWPSLKQFISGNGHIRLLCSPFLAQRDIQALHHGAEAKEEERLIELLRKEIEMLLSSPFLSKPTRVLACLVATGILELRIAFVGQYITPQQRRLFHDKLGIFSDAE